MSLNDTRTKQNFHAHVHQINGSRMRHGSITITSIMEEMPPSINISE
jgi:hypothetical protein